MKRILIIISVPILFFIGCSTTQKVQPNSSVEPLKDPTYSLIYLIHGDANYLYHKNGQDLNADKEALIDALDIAKNAHSGEVFIFHQKPENKILGLFPKKDRVFYHYRNGILINKSKYSPVDGGFSSEVDIYQSLSSVSDGNRFLFYFGHEVPTFDSQTYHASQPEANFDTDIFADDISGFGGQLSMTVLSTCNNGSPQMMEAITGKTKVVIASPQNLHLSYLSLDKLSLLEEDVDISPLALADSVAQDSFKKLSSFLQTMVTVSIYDLDRMSGYLPGLATQYEDHLKSVEATPLFTDNSDCNTLMDLKSSMQTNGVKVYYKAPAFGRKSGDKTHSGWGCKE